MAALRPVGPYPVLALHGEHGSAKSSASRVLSLLADPHKGKLRQPPKSPHDTFIAAANNHVVAFDNLSHIEPWLSDCLCVLATGGGYATRKLYMDEDEQVFDAQRPILLNGINEVAHRADLLDRTLTVQLARITKRRHEREFWTSFEAARPRILGALLSALAGAQSRLDSIDYPALPRMADFAALVIAAEPALGWPEGSFLNAYAANSQTANQLALEGDILVPYLRKLLEGQTQWP